MTIQPSRWTTNCPSNSHHFGLWAHTTDDGCAAVLPWWVQPGHCRLQSTKFVYQVCPNHLFRRFFCFIFVCRSCPNSSYAFLNAFTGRQLQLVDRQRYPSTDGAILRVKEKEAQCLEPEYQL